jgi:WD40 repeat protein/mono/diheme cytochrome c family protein
MVIGGALILSLWPFLLLQPTAAGLEEKAGGKASAASPVTFYDHLEPILRDHCLGCHSGERPKGRLSLTSFEELKAGGKRGVPVVPGKPEESLLYLLLTGARKPSMPPEKEGRLSEPELARVRAWIAGGCLSGEARREPPPYSRPLEPPVYPRPPAVTALTYSPDGALLYVAGYREVLVHRPESAAAAGGLPEARLLGEAEQLNALQISSDGKLLAAAGGSPARFGELQLWDTAGRKLLRFIRLGKDTLYAAAFSAAGDRIVVGGTDRALHLLEVKSGKELYAIETHADWVLGLAFSAGDERIVSAGRDKTVKVSVAASGEFLKNLENPGGPIFRVVARPGTSQFLAGGDGRKPLLFDAKEMKQVKELEGQPGAILAAAFSADGKLVAVGTTESEVRVYQVENASRIATLKAPGGWVYALAFRPDGQRLAVSGYEGQVRLFEVPSGKEVATFPAAPVGRLRSF